MLKDTDLMPFGKFKGTAMANMKASYLLWLYGEMQVKIRYARNKLNALNAEEQGIYDYVVDNLTLLHDEASKEKAADRYNSR